MNTITVKQEITDALNAYVSKLKEYSDNDFKQNYPNLYGTDLMPSFEVNYLQKWIKIVRADVSQKSVFCFIDPVTGDIYKADSWKVPAKGIRGNIFNEKLPLTGGSLYR